MKYGFAALAALTVIAGGVSFASATPADAQSRGAPRGSYAQSCSGSYVNQGRLYADCRNLRGQMRETSIQLNRCGDYDIQNRDGLLMCGPNRGDYEDNNRPGGNRPGGGWDNGRPGQPGRPGDHNRPGQGWDNGRGGSITVYRDSQFRGASQTFDGAISNLRSYGMNDSISSLRISRGTWEVCEHADFRGRCETVRGDVRDLNRLNFNDKISSIRPAGRR